MPLPNPFITFYHSPILTLAALAYTLLLAGVTTALAGYTWEQVLWLDNAITHRQNKRFGPAWEYVPPRAVYLRLSGVLLLAALEAALIGGILHVAINGV